MKKLLKLNMRSNKVCFLIETEPCCGEVVTDKARFHLEVYRDCNDICGDPLITYHDLDVGEDGSLCIPIEECFRELCSGRYVFRIVLDECINLKDIKFLWGSTPKVTSVDIDTSDEGELLPPSCCPKCGCEEVQIQECGTCCDRCSCPIEFADPTELLARDC